MAKRDIKYGNDIFRKINLEQTENIFELTYWDLWVVLLCQKLFGNKWYDLKSAIEGNCDTYNRYNCESMLSHIQYLREKLSSLYLNHADIVSNIDEETIRRQLVKAKKKVLTLGFQEKEKSYWMLNTPRIVFSEKAIKGNSKALPESTKKYVDIFRKKFKTKTHYNEDQACDLSEKLSFYIEKNENIPISKRSAFYRAFLTVIVTNMDNIDDSFGQIGMLTSEVFEKYLAIPWRELNVKLKHYFDDLINFVIWEDYGSTAQLTSSLFLGLTIEELQDFALMLHDKKNDLKINKLNYQAEKAFKLIETTNRCLCKLI